jgi:hypothetical protein
VTDFELSPGELPFQDRIVVGHEWEAEVADRIRDAGWTCDPIGQGMLSPPMRRLLQRKESLMRRMPDLLAARRIRGRREELLLVDPKSSMGESPRWPDYTLEKAAHAANVEWTKLFYPAVYVWPDANVNYAWDLRPVREGSPREGRTPFWKIPKRGAYAFDDIFGPAETPTWPRPKQFGGACAQCTRLGMQCQPCTNEEAPMQQCQWCGWFGRGFTTDLCGICEGL